MNLANGARKLLRLLPAGLLVLAASWGTAVAHAAAEIHVVDVAFIPPSITLDATSTLRVELRNNGAGGQRASIDYSLAVPAGLAVNSHQLGQDCDAAAVTFITDDTQSGVLRLIGLTLLPSGTCTVDLSVSAAATGQYTFEEQGNGSTILSTTLTVTAAAVPEAAAIAVSPTSVPFPPQEVGVASAARLVTVSNPAAVTLSLTGISVSGPFATTSECNTAILAPGGECTFAVAFTPTATGLAGGSIQVISNAPAASIALSGEGIAALPSLFPAGPLQFGVVAVGTSATAEVMLTNSAEATAALTISGIAASGTFYASSNNCPVSLGVGDSCTIVVSYGPTAAGEHGGALAVGTSAGALELALSGSATVLPVPAIAATPSSANFGALLVGDTSNARFFLSSTGQADLSIAVISVDGAHFAQSNNTCPPVLAAGANCEIEVTYAPTASGSHTGELRVTSNAVPSTLVIPLSGNALAQTAPALALSRDHLAFGPGFVDRVSSPGLVTVTNAGTGPLHIASIASEGDFGYSGCGFPSTLLPGESCALWITFRPLSEGPAVGRMQVFSDAPGSPHAIALSGTGILGLSPQIELNPSAHDFGTLRVGDDEMAPMRLTNVGNMALTISAISTAGASFTQASSCPASLAPGASCDIEVTYAPSAAGAHSGQLRIDSNATPARYVAALSGTATPVPPPFMVVDRVVDFGQQLTRTLARATLEIRNSGGLPLVITGMRFSGASVFGVEGGCGAIAPKGLCSLTVLFSPAAAGAFAGRMEIASNHARGVVVVELVGQGVRSPQPDLELSVEGLGFGNQVIGSLGDPRIVGLANVGSLPLQFLGFAASVDFLVDSSRCPAQLLPDESCEVRVTFKPVAPGPRGGELTITSNAIGAPHSVSLTGTGCRFFTMRAARSGQALCGP